LKRLLVTGCWFVVVLGEHAQSRDKAPRTSNQQPIGGQRVDRMHNLRYSAFINAFDGKAERAAVAHALFPDSRWQR
jgi:hypothetical protein